MLATATRECHACNKPVKGRTDKKFCDDYCRNNYHNQLKSDSHSLVRKVNHILSKNRRILEALIPAEEEMARIQRDVLIEQGFHFRYQTHHHTNQAGALYHYVYDYGYLELDNDWFLLVKSNVL